LNIPSYMLPDFQRGFAYHESHHSNPYWLVQFILKPEHPVKFDSIFYSLLALAYLVYQCALWLWWCDAHPRRHDGMVASIGAWVFYSFIITWFQPMPVFWWDRTGQVFFRTSWYQTVGNVSGWLNVYFTLIVLASVLYISIGFVLSRRDTFRMEDSGNHMSAA